LGPDTDVATAEEQPQAEYPSACKIELNKALNQDYEDVPVNANYHGMSPDVTPASTPRTCLYPPGIWIRKEGAPENPQRKWTEGDVEFESDPPTPDPHTAWRMQKGNEAILQLGGVQGEYQGC
jgi:hypothetical protein